jgi:hypothetical protein
VVLDDHGLFCFQRTGFSPMFRRTMTAFSIAFDYEVEGKDELSYSQFE